MIVIETKKGKSDQFQVKVDAMYGVVDLGKQLDFMSPRETLEWERLLYVNYYNEYYDDKITVDGEKVLILILVVQIGLMRLWEAVRQRILACQHPGEMHGQNSLFKDHTRIRQE